MDARDRLIINELQGGFPICERPYAETGAKLGMSEDELIARIDRLLATETLSRFGPLYHAERMGGGLSLAAMRVPETDFDRVTQIVNAFPEVAHNYARDHELNMWFVISTEHPERVDEVMDEITRESGYAVYKMPKEQEFFIGLRLEA